MAEIVASQTQTPILSLRQAAEYLGISKAHMSNVLNGKVEGVPQVRSFRLGRRVLIKREWIDHWLEATRPEAPGKC